MITRYLFLILIMCGCDPEANRPSTKDEDLQMTRVVVIDGCQYLRSVGAYGYYSFCHKGNCTNSLHYYLGEAPQHAIRFAP